MKRGSVTELIRRRPPHLPALLGLFAWLPVTFAVAHGSGYWWLWAIGIFCWLLCIWDLAWAVATPRLRPMEKVAFLGPDGKQVTLRVIQITMEPGGGMTAYMETDSTFTARHTY